MSTKKKVATPVNPNADPITGEHGAHPVGVGVGTAGGASAGAALGAVGGPIGAVVGAVVGGVAGAFAGKEGAEALNPTDEAHWKEHFSARPYAKKDPHFEHFQPAYGYGAAAARTHAGQKFADVEPELSKGWSDARGASPLAWEKARPAVRDAFDRTLTLHAEELRADKVVAESEVRVRKEVVTEHQKIDVPVEREEVVIERRPVNKSAHTADIKASEIRIPVKEERVKVAKETVVTEEVDVSKRKHHETKHVEGDVRKEKLKVDKKGDVDVRERVK